MANLMPYFVISELQAAQFRQATQNRTHKLEPVLIRGGSQQGKYAIPTRVAQDPNFADLAPAFAVMTPMALITETAFPPVPDED